MTNKQIKKELNKIIKKYSPHAVCFFCFMFPSGLTVRFSEN